MIDDDRGPSMPVVSEDRVGVLSAYVATNRDRFTDEALRAAARTAGYSDSEIGAAWAAAADPRRAIPSERRTERTVVVATAIAFVLATYGGWALLGSAATGPLSGVTGWIGPAALLLGIVGWVLLRDRNPSLASGLGWGVVLAVVLPIVLIVGLLGICLVGGSTGIFVS